MDIKTVILAAGKGTRMKSNTPKVLHKIMDKTLLGYVLDNVKNISQESFVIVGHHAEDVEKFVEENYQNAKTVLQSPQLGTGDAVSKVCHFAAILRLSKKTPSKNLLITINLKIQTSRL